MKTKKFSRNFTLIASMITLFGVSYHFNKFVDQLEDEGLLYDNLDVVVIIGVGFSLLPLRFIFGKQVFWTAVLMFMSSAPPVIIGYRKRCRPHFFLADLLHREVRAQLR